MKSKLLIILALLTVLVGCQEEEKVEIYESYPDMTGENEQIQEDVSHMFKDSEDQLVELDGDSFPDFETIDFQGNHINQDIFKEKDLTLVNFWFSGCGPCIDEMPTLEYIDNKYDSEGVQVLGICTDSNINEEIENMARKILKETGVTYSNLMMDNGPLQEYSMGIYAYPTSMFVDSQGKIVGEPIIGAIITEEHIKELEDTINDMLSNL